MQTPPPRLQLPSLPEWLLRDPLSAIGIASFGLAGFLAVKTVADVFLHPERGTLAGRLTGLLLFLIPALIIYVTRMRRRLLQWTLARSGTPVEARVDQVTRGTWTVNDVPYVHAQYTYSVAGREFQGWTPERHPEKLRLARGERIVVWVDLAKPARQVWLDPNEDYSTMLTESRIMGSLVQYPGELIFLGSVIFVTMMVSMFGRDFAEQAHEYATQHDPNMLGLAVGLILMIVSTFVVGRMDSRRTATVAQAAGWAAFAVGFYGPWAASGFRTGLLAFLLILAMVIWMIAKNARFGRRK